ncbi:cytochrome C oxidase subunit IV family protein [Cupriavidus taiwanensis]|uniref:Putative bb3-type cytochrome oxidase subunit IV n=1 Tax=Cupriavidus taiwanensis TaxID=164546 RepID=A0A375HL43_9BURK|nr:cytochrome C oxidase subunit IV family protein [Cupriavidus taiwanensis]SOY67237.1 bb3-type cytochrome oxidase subunit IV [Cupriavidus taiwanensis]SOY67497.1 bb3-type cytochrome oxidase subunit IV [Cupriavidus taiwanensis]SOY94857.1 bb3-type cytochrome oxidase subunit IV [Cupriavidus taiwanensis]SOZ28229.1 bb3-type cytochrome oxidase subunit IV [Cupriavidus taiwanensis]SOZ71807.1 bb3-type cytochrome oxidase subunit IV [Cupriavidus taiwanensis]
MASNPATPAAPATPPHGTPHGSGAEAGHAAHHGQEHPIGLYLKIWLLLFVLSTLSYLVDYFHFTGYLRWTLILLFMGLKAGLIVAVFMHMAWERMALICAILIPPLCLLVLVWLMAEEANHTFLTRGIFFR